MGAETPGSDTLASRQRIASGRRRLPWRPLLVVLGIVAAMTSWYVLTVDAIRSDLEWHPEKGQETTLAGVDPEEGIGFIADSLKNVSVLPITILGMEPVKVSSDWRVREMRLGILASEGEDALAQTRPFTPQHLAPGEVTHVVIVWAALPCDSPRLADGTVRGPVEFRIVYSILGVRRILTVRQGGGEYGPLSVIGCPTS